MSRKLETSTSMGNPFNTREKVTWFWVSDFDIEEKVLKKINYLKQRK